MMEEEFYATVKLVSGEEVFAQVSASEEEDRTLLILDTPVIITPMLSKTGFPVGYKVEPWINMSEDDMHIIDLKHVITMSEVDDQEIINIYKKYSRSTAKVTIDRRMGFISKVNEARMKLEKAYKNS